tara:strand:- start:17 stop:799 length:783 start_codon:yes stop_codon:yes gene_type:complete
MAYIGQAPTKVPLTSADITDGTIALADIAINQIDETLMKDAFVGDFSDVTVTAADAFLYGDATDSGNTKKDTIQGILDLATGGGAWTYLSTTTASNTSSIDITSADGLDNSVYSSYAFYLESVYSNTSGETITLLTSDSNGVSYDGSSYFYAFNALDDAGTDLSTQSGSASYIPLGSAGAGSEVYGHWGWIYASGAARTVNGPGITFNLNGRDAGNDFFNFVGGGAHNDTHDSGGVDAYRLVSTSGNISGNVYVYGVKLS